MFSVALFAFSLCFHAYHNDNDLFLSQMLESVIRLSCDFKVLVLNFGNGLSTCWDKAACFYLLEKKGMIVEIIILLIEVQFCEYGRLKSSQFYSQTHSLGCHPRTSNLWDCQILLFVTLFTQCLGRAEPNQKYQPETNPCQKPLLL